MVDITTGAVAGRKGDLADELVETASGLALQFNSNGPDTLARLAESLSPGAGWNLLAAAREELRSIVIRDPTDLAAVVSLAWVTAALGIRGSLDRENAATPVVPVVRPDDTWGKRLRALVAESDYTPKALAGHVGIGSTILGALQRRQGPPADEEGRSAAVRLLLGLGEELAVWDLTDPMHDRPICATCDEPAIWVLDDGPACAGCNAEAALAKVAGA